VRRRATAVLLTAAGLWCIGARPLRADAAARPAPRVVLAPAAGSQLDGNHDGYAVAVQAGGGVWQSVVVESHDDARLTVTLTGTGAAGKWAHPSNTTIVLGPHQRAPVPFTVAPPAGTAPGRAAGALTATVAGSGETASIAIVVNVTTGAAVTPRSGGQTASPPNGGASANSNAGAAGATAASHEHSRTSSSDIVMMIAVVAALALLVLAMIVPPTVQRLRQRRAERRAGTRGLRLAWLRAQERAHGLARRRRTERIADAASAAGTAATVAPSDLTRADVRRAEQQRRVAERRERLRAERDRLRAEAQRVAAEAWDERVREMRERAEAEARARAEAIEDARRLRAGRAAELVTQRRVAEERRLERLRAGEARRREETAQRARQRASELAARKRLGREADAALQRDVVAEDLQRQRENELSRAAVVQLRSEEARELARSWIVTARAGDTNNANNAPAPLPGEGAALEHLLVELPEPGSGATDDAPAIVADETSPEPTASRPQRAREKVAVVALDVELLNARLRGQ
jgi:hypothetical protein